MTAGNGKIVFVGLDAIMMRLAEIGPKDYFVPGENPEPHNNVVGTATDAIKKMATLRHRISKEIQKLSREQDVLSNDIGAVIETEGSLSAILESVKNDDAFIAKVKRHEELALLAAEPEMLAEVVDKLLWVEIRKTFPQLAGKPAIGFDSQWNVYWTDKASRRRGGGLGELLRALRPGGDVDVRLM